MTIRSFFLYTNGAQGRTDLALNVWRIAVICRALKFYLEFIQQHRDDPDRPTREQGCVAWLIPRLEEVRDKMGWHESGDRFPSHPTLHECAPAAEQPYLFPGYDIFSNKEAAKVFQERQHRAIAEVFRRREKSATPIVDDDR